MRRKPTPPRLRDQCPRNSDLIKVEEIAAADD